jgi:hypothetical protein
MTIPPPLSLDNNLPPERPDFWECAQGICVHPYVTIRRIVDYDSSYGQLILLGALVITSAAADLKNGIGAFLLAVFVYAGFHAFNIYSLAALFWITGKPLNGKARFIEVCAAIVWPFFPVILGNIVGFAISPFLGPTLGIIIVLLASLYSFKLMIGTLAEVQGFTLGQSLLNQLLAALLGLALLLIPIIIFWGAIFALVMAVLANMNVHVPA